MKNISSLLRSIPCYLKLRRTQYRHPEAIERLRQKKIERTLTAGLRIPFYRKRWKEGVQPADIPDLPITKREDISELNESVRSLYPEGTGFLVDRSSGSTGMPVEFIFDVSHQAERFACRIRYLRENGWSPFKRCAWIIPIPKNTPDGKLIRLNKFWGMKFLSLFNDFEYQLNWLKQINPYTLYTLPSNLEGLLNLIEKTGIKFPRLHTIFTGGEVLEKTVSERASKMLNVRISDNYGSTEAFPAWQCPAGNYHINSEHVLLEIVDENGNKVNAGESGRIILTTLDNYIMPLIRYQIGDYGIASDTVCSCGRTLPCLQSILGRSIDLFRLKNGKILSPWEIVVRIKYNSAIKQFQIIQNAYDRFVFRYKPQDGADSFDKNVIRRCFTDVIRYPVDVEFQKAEKIDRLPSGKFRTAISNI